MMLRAELLTIRQGSFLLSDVSIECPTGGCLALVGASGSGKSTCLEIMAGLRRARSGRVWIDGRDVTAVPPEQRGVSYLPQDVALFPHLTIMENIRFPVRMRGLMLDTQRLNHVTEMLGIDHLLDRADVVSLSGGEAQRVAIARALMVPPKVLFLDECFGALDAPLRRRLARQFRALREATGTTTVIVTHDPGEACLMADRLVLLHQGRVQQIGTPEQLHQRPATTQVAELLGMQNILSVRSSQAQDGYWRCDVGGLELCVPGPPTNPSPPGWIGFHSCDVAAGFGDGERQYGPGTNLLRLPTMDCIRMGSSTILRLSSPTRQDVVVEVHCLADHRLAVPTRGDFVQISIPPGKIHAWPRDGLPV